MLFIIFQLLALIIFISICTYNGSAEETNLSELTLRGDLPPIRATYSGISLLVKDIEELVTRSTNSDGEEKESKDKPITYQIAAKQKSLAGISFKLLLEDPKLPNPAYIFKIHRYDFNSSISTIDVEFGDYLSYYRFSGTDMLQLESLRDRIESFAQEHSTWFGGNQIIFSIYILFVGAGLGLISLAGQAKKPKIAIGIGIAGIFVIILGIYITFSRYLDALFPRTAIYLGSASYMERTASVWTFWGFVISVIGTVISVVTYLYKRKE